MPRTVWKGLWWWWVLYDSRRQEGLAESQRECCRVLGKTVSKKRVLSGALVAPQGPQCCASGNCSKSIFFLLLWEAGVWGWKDPRQSIKGQIFRKQSPILPLYLAPHLNHGAVSCHRSWGHNPRLAQSWLGPAPLLVNNFKSGKWQRREGGEGRAHLILGA